MYCSSPEHGHCSNSVLCVNCKQDHKANDRRCIEYRNEEAALLKANAEHLSVGYAKKLLGHQLNYARAAKVSQTNNVKVNKRDPPPLQTSYRNDNSNAHQVPDSSISQDMLPDLNEALTCPKENDDVPNNRKRERQPSSSPPNTPKTITSNRFNILENDDDMITNDNIQLEIEKKIPTNKKVVVEVHQPPQSKPSKPTKPSKQPIPKGKPNITRGPRNKSHKKKDDLLLNYK